MSAGTRSPRSTEFELSDDAERQRLGNTHVNQSCNYQCQENGPPGQHRHHDRESHWKELLQCREGIDNAASAGEEVIVSFYPSRIYL